MANTTTPLAPHPDLPPGMTSLTIVRPALQALITVHTFTTLLTPLFIALFYHSTAYTRRQPIFILNVIALGLALGSGVMYETLGVHALLSPQVSWPKMLIISLRLLGILQCMLVDFILLLRLISVHPLRQVGLRRFAILTFLPIFLKVARVINVIVFIKVLTDVANGPNGDTQVQVAWFALPYVKIEWVAEVVDNAYVSMIFLWTIHGRGSGSVQPTSSTNENVTFAQRLRTLFRIALSNFVIPTLFSIAQLIIAFCNPVAPYTVEIVYMNTTVSVCGVVFATLWVGKENRRKLKEEELSSSLDNSNRNRRVNGYTGRGVSHQGTLFSVDLAQVVDNPESERASDALDRVKGGASLKDGDCEIALLPLAKRETRDAPP